MVDPGIEFNISKRGLEPDGGGEITFICPSLKLKAVQVCCRLVLTKTTLSLAPLIHSDTLIVPLYLHIVVVPAKPELFIFLFCYYIYRLTLSKNPFV